MSYSNCREQELEKSRLQQHFDNEFKEFEVE
jgi:hypothetical protein